MPSRARLRIAPVQGQRLPADRPFAIPAGGRFRAEVGFDRDALGGPTWIWWRLWSDDRSWSGHEGRSVLGSPEREGWFATPYESVHFVRRTLMERTL